MELHLYHHPNESGGANFFCFSGSKPNKTKPASPSLCLPTSTSSDKFEHFCALSTTLCPHCVPHIRSLQKTLAVPTSGRHATWCAICQTNHIIMFHAFTWTFFCQLATTSSPWMFDHPHRKTAEENVRWQSHFAHREASRQHSRMTLWPVFFKVPPCHAPAACSLPLQGAEKVRYCDCDWHSVWTCNATLLDSRHKYSILD